MRQFKFRAFDTKEKKWLYAYEEIGGFDIKGELILLGEYGSGLPLERFLNDVEITQYTGLKDKNGKEIYECDILSTSNDGKDGADVWSAEDWGYGVVTLNIITGLYVTDWASSLQEVNSVFSLEYVEVIGNIYQNPELLKS